MEPEELEGFDHFDYMIAYWRVERSLTRNRKERQEIVGAMHAVEAAREVNRQDGRIRSTDSIDRPFRRSRRPYDILTTSRPPRKASRKTPV